MRISETPSPTGSQSPKFPCSADRMRWTIRARATLSFRPASQPSNSSERRKVYMGSVYPVGYRCAIPDWRGCPPGFSFAFPEEATRHFESGVAADFLRGRKIEPRLPIYPFMPRRSDPGRCPGRELAEAVSPETCADAGEAERFPLPGQFVTRSGGRVAEAVEHFLATVRSERNGCVDQRLALGRCLGKYLEGLFRQLR